MNNKKPDFIRRLLAITALTLGLLGGASSAQAQFRAGVSLSVAPQSGYTYFNPMQQQMLLAMKQRQNALSNYGTAINLQAARLSAQRQQIESFQRAQYSRYQAMLHYQRAQQMLIQQNTVINRANQNVKYRR